MSFVGLYLGEHECETCSAGTMIEEYLCIDMTSAAQPWCLGASIECPRPGRPSQTSKQEALEIMDENHGTYQIVDWVWEEVGKRGYVGFGRRFSVREAKEIRAALNRLPD